MKDMGKQTEDKLKVIFKTSLTTLCTHSKTCSCISQLSTRSGILRIQKCLRKKHSYYVDPRGKVKRDLSIETDICVLRRLCRQKLNMTSNLGSSAKSRYSAMDTEAETLEEFPDASACGDNEIVEVRSNYPTDLECLMVDNLKNLLGQWIDKHLIYKKDTKQKLDMIIEAIINKLKNKSENDFSSDTTYVIHKEAQDQEVKNKKIATAFSNQQIKNKSCRKLVTSKSSQKDSSSAPIRSPNKDIRIISTLSIPRTFNRRGPSVNKNHPSSCKLGKTKRKNIVLSIDKFSKLLDSNNFELLAVSSKSLTKNFSNCDVNLKNKNKKHIVFFPKPFYKNVTCSAGALKEKTAENNLLDHKKFQLDALPSLLRSLYNDDSTTFHSNVDKSIQFDAKNDNSTMTKNTTKDITTSILPKDNASTENEIKNKITQSFKQENINYLTLNKTTYTSTSQMKLLTKKNKKRGKVKKRRRQIFGNKISSNSRKLNGLDSKHFTFMYEKASRQILQGQDLYKYWQSLFQYFNESNNKKIKVDIHISLSPNGACETKDTCTGVSNELYNAYEIKGETTLLYNVKPETELLHEKPVMNQHMEIDGGILISSPFAPKIIPLLDGAASQAKYILNGNSRDKVEDKSTIVQTRCMLTSELEILQEISELKVIIKDLAMTTEKLVNKQERQHSQTSAKSNTCNLINGSYTSSSRCEAVINLLNPSTATQVCGNIKKSETTRSSSDTRKGAKTQDTLEYYNRLTKKSTSFRIIDSESLLRVTDMTSKANDSDKFNHQFADEALISALPKSLSLFELPTERNKKLIAFFCDNCVQPTSNYTPGCSAIRQTKSKASSKKWPPWVNTKKKDICCPRSTSDSSWIVPMTNVVYSSTSNCRSRHSMSTDEVELGKRVRGMGFREGCMYCMLLWIPVLILGCLFYTRVLQNYFTPSEKVVHGKRGAQISAPGLNSTIVYLKLSDLGF